MKRSALLFLAMSLVLQASSAAAVTQYNLTRLGAFGTYPLPGSGSSMSYAYAVNELGHVAGHVAYSGAHGAQAFLWKDNSMTPLGWLAGGEECSQRGCKSYAYGINDIDEVVGYSSTPLGADPFGDMAFRWESGAMTGLGWINPAYGCNVSTSFGINNLGFVVGTTGIPVGNACAVTDVHYDAFFSAGTMFSLDGIDTGTNIYSQAQAINRDGAVVGRASNPYNSTQNGAFVWTSGGGPVWIGDLGAFSGSGHTSYAYGINDAMDVVGTTTAPGVDYAAFIWSSTAGMRALGDLPGGINYSIAYGTNNNRQVVGMSYSSIGSDAFIWDSVNGMVSLNSLLVGAPGWRLTEARDINNSGQIVGWGVNPAGGTEAFLLTPAAADSPLIAFSPSSISFTANIGGANPASESLSIFNGYTGTLSWAASSSASWLTLTPTSGQQSGTVTLSVNIDGLSAGLYETSVQITGNTGNSPQSVPVTLTINSSPIIGYTTPIGGLSWTINEGSTSSTKKQLGITNTGAGTMSYSTSGDKPWIMAPSSGVLVSGAYTYVDVSVNPTDVNPGTIGGVVVITANGATNTPQYVGVTMTILPAITITFPNGNELLRSGSNVVITWNVIPPGQTVAKTETYYTVDGGSTWKLIKSQTGMKTSCAWRVPSVKTLADCRVWTKFKNAAGKVIASDESDTTFQIYK